MLVYEILCTIEWLYCIENPELARFYRITNCCTI